MRIDNPYHANGAIGPKSSRYANLYIERRGIDDEVVARLNRGDKPLGSYIYGSRQSGKTSLLYRLESELKEKQAWATVYVVLGQLQAGREDEWYRHIWDQLLRGLDISDSHHPSNALEFNSYLCSLNDRVRGLRVLVVWDELDALLKDRAAGDAAAQFLFQLRSFADGKIANRWAFVIAALRDPSLFEDQIAQQWPDPNSPPFNLFESFQLRDWAQSDTDRLGQLLGPAHSVEDGTLERVHWWTEGHPYLTQRLLEWLYDQESPKLRIADVDRGATEVSRDPRHMIQHLGHHIKALSETQRSLLLVLTDSVVWPLDALRRDSSGLVC